MKKLTLAPEGHWQRSNGEVVTIVSMIDPHLHHALRIVVEKLTEARRTRDRAVVLQEKYKMSAVPQARKILDEMNTIVSGLEAKQIELSTEISRRPVRAAP